MKQLLVAQCIGMLLHILDDKRVSLDLAQFPTL